MGALMVVVKRDKRAMKVPEKNFAQVVAKPFELCYTK
jgi:hypothetical protein